MAPEILKLFPWAPWNPQIASRGILDSPQQRSGRPHREAEGPANPPGPLRKRLSVYLFTILLAKSKNTTKGHRQSISKAMFGLSTSMLFLSFILVMFSSASSSSASPSSSLSSPSPPLSL